MLDQDTKRRIDTARDILVGKLPNPQAQVEQITIAMIYKFMDDMDKEAMEFGGEATFFTGEFEKYSWTKIFDPKLGGFEMLALYGEAIVKLNQNPSIPQLFRDIFKNAFLPYRDPETLKMFLKIINEFHYDHSEKLGDAFEYLLSVLGSQCDAGQFRTPRHIIDFMVAIIQPKKEESICDPACGTAGFLISSYKHILNENTKKNKGDLLTPDDRKKLINNFVGYDISAEMVRLSLVNLYLHGFTTPKIFEYDTLTSEDRWGDYFDIILANPPFMTPKGGIRPHKKFAMQANRSEVLFVDYIMEHINPTTGRAAIIVPEGIIFQNATAYKALRKLLVDKKYLYGVISLPAGIFQPYSGVKTSILLLDKSLAKKTDKILFVKIDNDGYSLGAQRKELSSSDLPDAVNFLKQYITALRNDDFTEIDFENLPLQSLVIAKSIIENNDEYILSLDKYKPTILARQTKFELTRLGDVVAILNGFAFKSEYYSDEGYRVIRITNVQKGEIIDDNPKFYPIKYEEEIKNYILAENDLLVSLTGNVGRVGLIKKSLLPAALNQRVACFRPTDVIDIQFLFSLLNNDAFISECINASNGIAQKNLSTTWLANYEIPLPPLSVQKEIVDKINQYQKVIDGAKLVIENHKSEIDINPNWEMVPLGSIGSFKNGLNYTKDDKGNSIKIVGVGDFKNYLSPQIEQLENVVIGEQLRDEILLQENDLVFVRSNGNKELVGRCMIIPQINEPITYTGFSIRLRFTNMNCLPIFYCYLFRTDFFRSILTGKDGANISNINQEILKEIQVPIISIDEQKEIVSQIEKEQILVNANKELIAIYEQKIKDEINKLWAE